MLEKNKKDIDFQIENINNQLNEIYKHKSLKNDQSLNFDTKSPIKNLNNNEEKIKIKWQDLFGDSKPKDEKSV